jgi:hypothetical protein
MIALMNRVFDLVPCLAPHREVGEAEHGFRDLDLSKPYAGGRRGRRVEVRSSRASWAILCMYNGFPCTVRTEVFRNGYISSFPNLFASYRSRGWCSLP